jgi:hypothetical protein
MRKLDIITKLSERQSEIGDRESKLFKLIFKKVLTKGTGFDIITWSAQKELLRKTE